MGSSEDTVNKDGYSMSLDPIRGPSRNNLDVGIPEKTAS